MLKHILIISCITLSTLVAQEIPNHSFEDWSDGDPVDWITTDVIGFDAVSQSSDAYEGSSSAYLEILGNISGVFLPSLQVGDGMGGIGTPISQRYASFGGYYKFSRNGSESFVVQVNLIDFNTNTLIGSGVSQFPPIGNWTEFNVPINYISQEKPNRAIIFITLMDIGGQGTLGSNANVDYVMFGAPSNVEQITGMPEYFFLEQNHPNPFNPSTTINFSIPEALFVSLKVFNSLGEEVETLVSTELGAGNYKYDWDAENFSSGIYFYTIQAGNFIETKKMILLK